MGNNILIIGSGVSGVGAAKLSKHTKHNVRVTSTQKIKEVNKNFFYSLGIDFEEGQNSISNLTWSNLIIKSPGVPPRIPLLTEARAQGIPIISEIEFASRFTKSNIIAITGTNGKTTTSKLLWYILSKSGLNVDLVGNIGRSFSESIVEKKFDNYVIELSSFQLEDTVEFRPNIAILLNIQEDHLNRYNNNFEEYIRIKMKIQMNQNSQDQFIYFANDSHINNHLQNVIANKYPFGDSKSHSNSYGAWLQKNKIIINTIKNNFTMTIHNLALQGTHNYYNSMAASIAASSMGIKNEIIKKCLSDFKGVEHRLEFVLKIAGVSFINDSKATNCNSVYYALDSINSPIIWICGGVDKGNKYSALKKLVKDKVKSIIYLGTNSRKIKNTFKQDVDDIVVINTMDEAVNHSYKIADVGDTILLSPACASFDLFKNYEERGRAFKSCVLAI